MQQIQRRLQNIREVLKTNNLVKQMKSKATSKGGFFIRYRSENSVYTNIKSRLRVNGEPDQ